ncbi:TAXI family TRAP transporter solute-binding subunit [Defluviitalea raffinosedens]|uniref:TAXI family TRAP transporter solute-binding subunit n=1 Tax=Defluviitalea raffinosedens TaxID=1450156 RepID=A0A7C8HG57_9FIRM|nr:TAXI family TRAP transporter solute-binding subunit [Defluviitalea raffinosedens]KAE9636989.1 TAXI family TRAP transporter solute-binding subunit [Defluviitalea raffinosedens]MBM7685258.1 TRAP transporter TAXI family solute receptor [Defluviitalea raffinosedens]HHW67303.1 TAXI family TRAP transporter solute-binding subunit [Candidatus Epulonipiscium sp.]
MRKSLYVLVSMVLMISLVLSGCGGKTTLKMATGGTTGTYYAYSGAVSQVLSQKVNNLSFNVQSTGASKANIYLVSDKEADMGIVQNDVMYYAYNGIDLFEGEKISGFSAMAGLYAEVCQIVSKKEITSIADLKGKRVSVGDVGSGVEFNARQILEAYDMTFDDIVVSNLSFGDSATALKDDKIDAFFCVAGAPTTAIVELATSNQINLLEIDDEHAAKLIEKYPFYTKFSVPGGSYKGVDTDVQTVAVVATYIVSDSLSEDLVYNMTKALFENADEIANAHPKGAELNPEYSVSSISIPIHPGAEKYYKEIGVLK